MSAHQQDGARPHRTFLLDTLINEIVELESKLTARHFLVNTAAPRDREAWVASVRACTTVEPLRSVKLFSFASLASFALLAIAADAQRVAVWPLRAHPSRLSAQQVDFGQFSVECDAGRRPDAIRSCCAACGGGSDHALEEAFLG